MCCGAIFISYFQPQKIIIHSIRYNKYTVKSLAQKSFIKAIKKIPEKVEKIACHSSPGIYSRAETLRRYIRRTIFSEFPLLLVLMYSIFALFSAPPAPVASQLRST